MHGPVKPNIISMCVPVVHAVKIDFVFSNAVDACTRVSKTNETSVAFLRTV